MSGVGSFRGTAGNREVLEQRLEQMRGVVASLAAAAAAASADQAAAGQEHRTGEIPFAIPGTAEQRTLLSGATQFSASGSAAWAVASVALQLYPTNAAVDRAIVRASLLIDGTPVGRERVLIVPAFNIGSSRAATFAASIFYPHRPIQGARSYVARVAFDLVDSSHAPVAPVGGIAIFDAEIGVMEPP